jgi:hypothetical protein
MGRRPTGCKFQIKTLSQCDVLSVIQIIASLHICCVKRVLFMLLSEQVLVGECDGYVTCHLQSACETRAHLHCHESLKTG